MRIDAAVSFLEPLAQLFGCCVERMRSAPRGQSGAPAPARLYLGTLRTAVEQGAAVHRIPEDAHRARMGFGEGPVMLVQCRTATQFAAPKTTPAATEMATTVAAEKEEEGEGVKDERVAALDLLREVGALLAAAQERAREGHTEIVPGRDAGKEWASTPRFNGTDGEARVSPLIEDSDQAGILGRNITTTNGGSTTATSTATITTSAADANADEVSGAPAAKRDNGGNEPEPKRRSLSRGETGTAEGLVRRLQPTPEQRWLARRAMLRRSRHPPRAAWEGKVEYARVGMAVGGDADTVCLPLTLSTWGLFASSLGHHS